MSSGHDKLRARNIYRGTQVAISMTNLYMRRIIGKDQLLVIVCLDNPLAVYRYRVGMNTGNGFHSIIN